MKLLSSGMAEEEHTQRQEWVWMEVSVWIRDYSGANVVNLDKVCWQSCVLAGTFHIQDHKGQLES